MHARPGAMAVPVTLLGDTAGGGGGEAAIAVLDHDAIALSIPSLGEPVRLPFAVLDGLVLGQAAGRVRMTLHVAGGDAIDVEGGDALRTFAASMERRATAVPEFTRALRAVGTRSGGADRAHDRFFAPLLEARAAAERADGWTGQVDAFAPDALRAAWADVVTALCAERYPASAPDRRALEAALGEALEQADGCLGRVATAADALRAADDSARLRRWRRWVDEIARLFVEADRCWLAALRELADAPPAVADAATRGARVGLWRRLRGGS